MYVRQEHRTNTRKQREDEDEGEEMLKGKLNKQGIKSESKEEEEARERNDNAQLHSPTSVAGVRANEERKYER
jgi:hypothetical protein